MGDEGGKGFEGVKGSLRFLYKWDSDKVNIRNLNLARNEFKIKFRIFLYFQFITIIAS